MVKFPPLLYRGHFFCGWLLLPFLLFHCAVHYDKQIQKTENYFFQGEFDSAIASVRPLAKGSEGKDRLLYLLEAGLIFHTQGNYETSNQLFMQADEVAEKTKKSISKEVLAFLLSDNEQNYVGENFERVLIKFYIALNYILMDDLDSARRYFKKLNFDLKDLKHFDKFYKQNLMARYLNAVVSEKFQSYNDARVEYKNIKGFKRGYRELTADQFVLAVKENDEADINKYKSGRKYLKAYNSFLQTTNYHKNMGELIIIHQAGKTMVKKSRGKLVDDKTFVTSLHVAVRAAILSKGLALTAAGVMSTLYTAENPVPVYRFRDNRKSWGVHIALNGRNIASTRILNDYSLTAVKNFNDNYKAIVAKNVASIAVKAVTAAVAGFVVDKAVRKAGGSKTAGSALGFLTGIIAGAGAGATVKPDLRCWHLLPSNFQVERIFLEEGEYDLEILPKNTERILTENYPKRIKIEKDSVIFVNVRTI